jgi:sugar isomerase (SIS)
MEKTIREIALEIKERLDPEGGIHSVLFVACGGSMTAMFAAKYFMENESKDLRVGYYTSNEFLHCPPPWFGKNSVVVTACQRGTTPETVGVVKFCKDRGIISIVLTNVTGSPITQFSDYSIPYEMGEEAIPQNKKPGTAFQLAVELLNVSEGCLNYESYLASYSTFNKIVHTMHESFSDRAQRMAEKFEAEPLIYMIGSGPSYGSARQESICVFMEMQWINSAVIHSGDFFHGPFEMTDEKNAFIVLVNDGKTRDLDERVVRFLAKHNAKFEALDAKEYGIEEVPQAVREYFNPLFLTEILHVFNIHLSKQRQHPMNIRRYMWKEEY